MASRPTWTSCLTIALALGACAEARQTARGDLVLRGAHLVGTGDPTREGRVASLLVDDGVIVALGDAADAAAAAGVATRDLSGRWLAPAFIDSHVHLVFLDVAAELPPGGVIAAVDLAAPIDRFFGRDWGRLRVLGTGPMVTAVGGYPTTSWGADGYGLVCPTLDAARAAIDELAGRGAAAVKIPLGAGPDLPDAVLRGAVAHAHARGLPVVVHALTDAAAARGADIGADVLAHTPLERLSDATIAAWSDKTVITTLGAFFATDDTLANVRRLRAAGARVLYGTDLGNALTARIDPDEVRLMRAAGLDGAAILAAATASPASFWGLSDLGRIAPGKVAALLVLAGDPRDDPATLGAPVEVLDLRP